MRVPKGHSIFSKLLQAIFRVNNAKQLLQDCRVALYTALLLLFFGAILGGAIANYLISYMDVSGRKMIETTLRKVIQRGKLNLLEKQTLGRVYIMEKTVSNDTKIGFIGVDTSDAGESLFIYQRILQTRRQPTKLIVDIGANDAFTSSNSRFYISLGWNAVLVEPLQNNIALARRNLEGIVDPYDEKKQKVVFARVAIGEKDGSMKFYEGIDDIAVMEGHLLPGTGNDDGSKVIQVETVTVETFVKRYEIPKSFGILSVDAEGVGDKILHKFLDLGFRPTYIIFEFLHNPEPEYQTDKYLKTKNYKRLGKKGWNGIYEDRFRND